MPGPFTRRNHSEDHRPGPDEDTDLVQDYALRLSISSIFEPEGTLLLTAIWRVLVCAIVAGLIMGASSRAPVRAQSGWVPDNTCFQSIGTAQGVVTAYVAANMCPGFNAMPPDRLMSELTRLNAVTGDFLSDRCQGQIQMDVMFRTTRKWIEQTQAARCASVRKELRTSPGLPDLVK
jgi:hypothetical protein